LLHLPALISDLAIILVTAGFVSVLFKKLGQPVVLGYLLAGILVGPEFAFFPTVQDRASIQVWAEIGVIVLLFALGLEFSFKKLSQVGRGATITALVEVFAMFGVGYAVGQLFDWNQIDSLFLGGVLAISSTTIIIRSFEELGLKQKKFAQLVFGVLIVEDLFAILLLVLLSTIAISQSFQGLQLLESTLRLSFFLTLWFVGGLFLVPYTLKKIRPYLNEETTLIVSLGLCLGMVTLAASTGFSPALGAFIMGTLLAETSEVKRIEKLISPVRDLFAAVFFVSVGMLFQFSILKDQWGVLIVLIAVTIVGKSVSSAIGALISGQRLNTSVKAGLSLGQIGEFSFIIATLGLTLKVTSEILYPLVVAVSVVTTFTTPYMIRSSDWINNKLLAALPVKLITRLNSEIQVESSANGKKLQLSILKLFLNSIAVVAFALLAKQLLAPLMINQGLSAELSELLALAFALTASLPFFWAIVVRPSSWTLNQARYENISTLLDRGIMALGLRVTVVIALIGFIVGRFTSASNSFALFLALTAFVGFVGFKNFASIYKWLEEQFMQQLKNQTSHTKQLRLTPWNVQLVEIKVHPDSPAVGLKISDLVAKNVSGVLVAVIQRGQRKILNPRHDEILMPFDTLSVIGNEAATDSLISFLAKSVPSAFDEKSAEEFGLFEIEVSSESPFANKSIRDSNVRESTGGLIVGLERGAERKLNPPADTLIQVQDRLWIVGEKALLGDVKF
jgi:CPA2 family monovalent cation:H+ antiporter-2